MATLDWAAAPRLDGAEFPLVDSLIVARDATWVAIPQSVMTHTGIDLRLAKTTILFALAAAFNLLTLQTNDFRFSRCGHDETLSRLGGW